MMRMRVELFEELQRNIIKGVVDGLREELGVEESSSDSEKRYMNKKEVIEFVGISYPTLDRWIDEGLEYSITDGSQYVFDKEDVVNFIKRNKVNYLEK